MGVAWSKQTPSPSPQRDCSSPWNFPRPTRLSEYTLPTLTPICIVGHIHLQAPLALLRSKGVVFWTTDLPIFKSVLPTLHLPSSPASFHNARPFCNHRNSGTCNKILLSWARGIASTSGKLILNHPGVLPFVYCSPQQSAHTDFHLFPHHVGIKSVSIFLPPSCLLEPPSASFLSRQQHA